MFAADLAVVLCVAAVTGVLARALRQSSVLGYLVAGLVVGPYLPIPLFADPVRVQALAEFGVVLVMFAIGLELRLAKLARVLPVSGLTAIVPVGLLVWCGSQLGRALGWGAVESLFLGAAMAIPSTMVASKLFEQVPVERDVRSVVLGALVVQDVLAIFLVAALTAVAKGGGLELGELATTVGRLVGVLSSMIALGLLIVPRFVRMVARWQSSELLVVVATGIAFGMAHLANRLGYTVALGAFIAGMLVAESGRGNRVEQTLLPLRDVFAAVFFVSVGMTVDPSLALEHAGTSLLVAVIVLVGVLASVACAGLLTGLGLRRSVVAGLALGPIGEFGFILAALGAEAGVVRPELQSIVVSAAVLTAFATPLLLAHSARIVSAIDQWLPRRVRQMLSLYESWLERFRSAPSGRERRSPQRRALRAIALDACGLLFVVALGAGAYPEASTWLVESYGTSPLRARLVACAVVIALALPLLLGLVRNTVALANLIKASVLLRYGDPSPAAQLAAHSSRLMVALGVLLAVGVPSVAVLQALFGGVWGIALLAGIALILCARLWLDAGALAVEYRSGAEEIAELLARQTEGEESAQAPGDLLPGLDLARSVVLQPGAPAQGRTLAELDLRARTGATVVAIQRKGGRVLMPTGEERLAAGDVLALVGTGDAVARAGDLFSAPEEPRPALSGRADTGRRARART